MPGDPAGQRFEPVDTFELVADLVVIHHLGKAWQPVLQRLLAILIEEEARASDSRGRTTRWFPVMMFDGSAGRMFETIRKRLSSFPLASNSGKYFWLARIVRIRHSCGTARNSASNSPT